MKVNPVTSAIAVALSCLIAYAFHSFGGGEQGSMRHYATTACALLFTVLTLLCAIGVEFGTGRTTGVIRSLAGASFLLGLGVLVVLSQLTSSIPLLVIVMGSIGLVFTLIAYAVSRSGQ